MRNSTGSTTHIPMGSSPLRPGSKRHWRTAATRSVDHVSVARGLGHHDVSDVAIGGT